jgi:hypothetical protein
MGIYSEYLDQNLGFEALTAERKKQLKKISELRGGDRDILVFAADLNEEKAPISIGYADLLPFNDQLANLNKKKIDIILETPGGSGEIAEDIVRLLHDKYEEVGIIIPGYAKSAGTIIAMAADEILMGKTSALGPIDAQITWQGKRFSAHALLQGMDKIKQEIETTGVLNKAYIPILQGISPGEIQNAQNALDFAKILVTDWLARYKFKSWETHSTTSQPVTEEDKKKRAREIADKLCDHGFWLTHGRSVKIADLEKMRVKITDYSKTPDLNEAITKYYTLLQMTFATNIYKVFETPDSQVYKFISIQQAPGMPQSLTDVNVVTIEIPCGNCKQPSKIQANLKQGIPLQNGSLPFPSNNKFTCPACGSENDLSDARRQIEAQTKKQIIQ